MEKSEMFPTLSKIHPISWRLIVLLIIAATLLSLTGCAGAATPQAVQSTAAVTQETNSKPYAGTTIHIIGEAVPPMDYVVQLLPKFEEETGIKVEFEQAPYESVVEKQILDLSSKTGNYDVISTPYEFIGSYVENGYIQPIDDFMSNPNLLPSDFDTNDLIKGMWDSSAEWKGKHYGFTSNTSIHMLFYRKDLFENAEEKAAFQEKYGYELKVPETWDQYRDIAEFFTREEGETLAGETLTQPFYGVTIGGKRSPTIILEWLNYAWSMGGGIFDDKGNLMIDSEGNNKALDYFKELAKFSPPGYDNFTWDEVFVAFTQGQAAMCINWNDYTAATEDQAQSRVAGKTGYAKLPVDPEVGKEVAHFGPWTWFIPSEAKNPEVAFKFLTWIASKEIQTEMAKKGAFPIRTSVYKDPQFASRPYWPAVQAVLEISTPRPRIPEWSEMADVMMLALSNNLTGQWSNQETLSHMNTEYQRILDGKLPIEYQ
jgi:multiple sugar transport system substrate-binding protein